MKNRINTLRRVGVSTGSKIATGIATVMGSGAALASGGSGSPGAAIAAELSGGKADMALVIGACAVLLGVVVVWMYVKRSAK